MKKYASWILIAAGLIIIGIAVFQEVSTIYNQRKLLDEYNEYVNILKNMKDSEIEAEAMNLTEELDIGIETNIQNTENSSKETGTEKPEVETKQTQIESALKEKTEREKFFENKVISGLVEIPKININSVILEGTDDSALKYAVGHYPGLGSPGKGNYVLLGHRNYVYGHFFRNLDDLEVGDEVIITKDTETYTYVVYESFVVKPEEVWVLEQTTDSIVTMITCTPIGTYTDRLIVRGALKDGV